MTDYSWHTHGKANLKFEAPTTWKIDERTPEQMVLTSPSGEIELDFAFVSMGKPEAAADERALMAHLEERMSDAKIVKPAAPKAQHGLKGFGLAGTGTRAGAAIEWFTFAIGDGKGHGLVALAMSPQGQMARRGEEMLRIIGSIQPAG